MSLTAVTAKPITITTVARKRRELMEAAISFVRTGECGTMRDRLRMASEMSGIPINTIEAAVGEVERLKVNTEKKS